MKNTQKEPQFVRYFEPVITALKALGNSGTPAKVRELIIQRFNITDEEIDKKLAGGASRFENQVAWARFYLLKGGYSNPR
jgi:restriction system protein